MFFVGIDIGKNNHVASMMDDTKRNPSPVFFAD